MPGSRLWETARRHGLLPGREIRSVFEMNLMLPGLRSADVRRSLRKGLWLKGAGFVRSGRLRQRVDREERLQVRGQVRPGT